MGIIDRRKPIMGDFQAGDRHQLESVARKMEQLFQMLPNSCSDIRCRSCWASRVIVMENPGAMPITLCHMIVATRNAMRLMVSGQPKI